MNNIALEIDDAVMFAPFLLFIHVLNIVTLEEPVVSAGKEL